MKKNKKQKKSLINNDLLRKNSVSTDLNKISIPDFSERVECFEPIVNEFQAFKIARNLLDDNKVIRENCLDFIEGVYSIYHTDMGCPNPDKNVTTVIVNLLIDAICKEEDGMFKLSLIEELCNWIYSPTNHIQIEKLIRILPNSEKQILKRILDVLFIINPLKYEEVFELYKNHADIEVKEKSQSLLKMAEKIKL